MGARFWQELRPGLPVVDRARLAPRTPGQAASQKAALARGHQAGLLAAITGYPASSLTAAADAAGFTGTVLWPGDSLSARRAMLRELGG